MTKVAPARLDRETVVVAAADLADREGWAAVTLSQVAREVDRHVTTLYAHVDSLAALQHAIAGLGMDELAELVWRAAVGKVKGEALEAIAEVYRRYAIEHPGRTTAMWAVRSSDDPELAVKGARLAEPVRATFRSFGIDADDAVIAHSVFSAVVAGFVRRPGGGDPGEYRHAIGLLLVGLESGAWPTR